MGYEGEEMFDTWEPPVTDSRLEKCSKRLISCRIRGNLPHHSGCPGMRRYN
ncbi:hypothetical protein [Chromobacterium sp. ATCC 53434]|uniref:hypothetical protein n=1 Tax=Chromobacterium sp. (strain ATCC 53434 / SC 14030) TaxID=2059672 RepID=UPI003511AB8F